MTKEKEVIHVVRVIPDTETVLKSLTKDLGTYLLIVLVIGTGVYLQSSAMQWVGFLLLIAVALSKTTVKKMKPEEAIKFIKEKTNEPA